MFTWIGKQGVRSSDGFEVQSVSRFSVQYCEGPHAVTIEIENGYWGGGPSVAIKRNAFERWDHSSVIIDTIKQAKMLANFTAAMSFQNIAVEP